MSSSNVNEMKNLYSIISFCGGGGGDGADGGGVQNSVAWGVCALAGGAAGTVVAAGTTVATKSPVAGWAAGAAAGAKTGEICMEVFTR